MTLVEPKPSPRPWFAVWRAERGTFGQLPLLARALFVEILKLTDDEGVIDLAGREPADAIAWALGADRSDRRALAKCVPLLLDDGCLVRLGDRLIAPSFARWQPKSKATKPVKQAHEAGTNEPRPSHDAAAMVSRSHHETEANRAESLRVEKESRVEESRVEDNNVEGAAAPDPAERIRELSERYPAELLAEARGACALSRKSGRMADSVWLTALEKLATMPAGAVVEAMRVFVDKHADGDKAEAYLIAVAKSKARGKRAFQAPSKIDPVAAAASVRAARELFGEVEEAANG